MTLHFPSSSSPGLTGGSKPKSGEPARGLGPPARLLAARGMTMWGVAVALMLAPPAFAHDGHHETMAVAEQVQHLLSQPDHILAVAGLVVAAIAGRWFWRRAKVGK